MVWLDGGISDESRLAAVADMARWLDAQVVIGLFCRNEWMPRPGNRVVARRRDYNLLGEARVPFLIAH